MFFLNYKKLENHEENLHKLCLLCLKKSKKMFIISDTIKSKLSKCCTNYSNVAQNVPKVLCPSCEKKLHRASQANKKI